MPQRHYAITCRTCSGIVLRPDQREGVSFYRCPQCRGVWIGHDEFWTLYRAAQPTPEASTLTAGDEATRACPMCDAKMLAASVDLLQLDHCPRHGIWCDTSELERAIGRLKRRDFAREFVRRLLGDAT